MTDWVKSVILNVVNVMILVKSQNSHMFPQSSKYITNQLNVEVKQNYSGPTPEITLKKLTSLGDHSMFGWRCTL